MFNRYRHLFGVLFFLLVASCSGGGCSGCGGCAGTTPLPGGFPKDQTIPNAATVRVSRPGLDFVEKSLPAVAAKVSSAPGGVLGIDVPDTDPGNTKIASLGILGDLFIDPHVCPGGPSPTKCHASVGIGTSQFQIDAVTPHDVKVTATLPLELVETPLSANVSWSPPIGGNVNLAGVTIHIGYGAGGCNGDGTANITGPHNLPVGVSIPIVAETIAPRDGYSKIDVNGATIDLSGLSENDVHVCVNCGGGLITQVCNAIVDSSFVKGLVLGPLRSGLQNQVKGLLSDQLCTAPSTALNPPCPTGSSPDSGNKHCVYDSDKTKCVPILLGTDAHIDLSGALASISPGTAGGLDFGIAANGDMQPFPKLPANAAGRTPNGITLGMIGGALPKPPSKCVPQVELKPPQGIPVPDELAPTAADPATTPHIGIALAGRFIDYSMTSVYDSGLLCLGVSTDQQSLLKAGLLSLIVPSLKMNTFEQGDAAAAIATRPQAAPQVKIGTGKDVSADPLLAITLPSFAIDFYVWSYDRYVRAFTFTADITIPVNLTAAKTTKGTTGLAPTLGDFKIANAQVTNNDLILDDPAIVANALGGLLGAFSKQLVGNGFSPIDLSSALSSFGLGLDVANIGKLTKGSDDFIGIFTNLSKAAGPATIEGDTTAVIVSKTVPKDHMGLSTMSHDAMPELVVDVTSTLDDGKRTVEYAWWIDSGTRSEWTTEKHLVLHDNQLLMQGHHTLRVVSRIAGETATEDSTPAEAPFVIDALAPFVTVRHEGNKATIDAWDIVSEKDALLARFKRDAEPFGEWKHLAEIGAIDVDGIEEIDVEVKDEEGNVRQVQQGLIRGRADSSLAGSGSGCGCEAPGTKDKGGIVAILVGVAGLALIMWRRRRFLSGGFALRVRSVQHAGIALGAVCAVASTSQGCACGSSADSGPACGPNCDAECKPPLDHGQPGSYTSVAKSKDNTIWVAGYNNALIDQGDAQFFGDLVVGKYDLGKNEVEWTTVDGVPKRTQGCPDRAPDSWRSGESDAGDDVGLWTSIQMSSEDHPIVSYYDATNHRLKIAWNDDDGWHNDVVREAPPNGDAGRYSKLIIVDGKAIVAFLQVEPGDNGFTRSKIVVGRSHDPTPHGAGSFDFEDVVTIQDNPCGATTCAGGTVCDSGGGLCVQKTDGCTPADCGTGKACATVNGKAACVSVKDIDTYPNVLGDYISIANGPGGLGIAAYDRPHGNLVAFMDRGGGKWDQAIIDGETGSRADKTAIDTGDVGIGTSLFIAGDGTWHLSYVQGLDESLRYITFKDGKPGKSEIIDDGSGADGKTFPDGLHVVGDDSTIRVDGDIITVYYQDATQKTLRRAAGSPKGSTHSWDLRALPQPDRLGGFFPALVPGEDKVANYWEQTDQNTKSMKGDVTIISP
jgi:MYXO-CTERM domain-containing protein